VAPEKMPLLPSEASGPIHGRAAASSPGESGVHRCSAGQSRPSRSCKSAGQTRARATVPLLIALCPRRIYKHAPSPPRARRDDSVRSLTLCSLNVFQFFQSSQSSLSRLFSHLKRIYHLSLLKPHKPPQTITMPPKAAAAPKKASGHASYQVSPTHLCQYIGLTC
jgi:hypothetical protein